MLSGFPSSYSVFEIWYVFYPYGTSQSELATFHTLPGNMGLIGTELDSPALPHAASESKYFPTLIERIPCGWFFFPSHFDMWKSGSPWKSFYGFFVFCSADCRYTANSPLVLILTMKHSLSSWSMQPKVRSAFLKPTVNPFKRQIKQFPIWCQLCVYFYTRLTSFLRQVPGPSSGKAFYRPWASTGAGVNIW